MNDECIRQVNYERVMLDVKGVLRIKCVFISMLMPRLPPVQTHCLNCG